MYCNYTYLITLIIMFYYFGISIFFTIKYLNRKIAFNMVYILQVFSGWVLTWFICNYKMASTPSFYISNLFFLSFFFYFLFVSWERKKIQIFLTCSVKLKGERRAFSSPFSPSLKKQNKNFNILSKYFVNFFIIYQQNGVRLISL